MAQSRRTFNIPRSNVGLGGFINTLDGTRYHVPSWTVVDADTTFDDLILEPKPFQELFEEPKTWKFKSASSDKEYTVREGRNGLHCDCWGYIAHRKCKHIKEVQNG